MAQNNLGTDEETITGIITNRSNAQRQETKEQFAQMFGKVPKTQVLLPIFFLVPSKASFDLAYSIPA